MTRNEIVGGVISCALHAALFAALFLVSAPQSTSDDRGDARQTVQITLVPSDAFRREAKVGEAAPALAQAAPSPEQTTVSEAPSQESPTTEPAHEAGGGSPPGVLAAYHSTADYSAFRNRVLNHIRPYQYYPDEARAARQGGVVYVGFVMLRDGTVREIWVEDSSGIAVLDAAAMDTVRRAQPLPLIPASLPEVMDVMLPIGFTVPARIGQS